jgi:hypothetical protein
MSDIKPSYLLYVISNDKYRTALLFGYDEDLEDSTFCLRFDTMSIERNV